MMGNNNTVGKYVLFFDLTVGNVSFERELSFLENNRLFIFLERRQVWRITIMLPVLSN